MSPCNRSDLELTTPAAKMCQVCDTSSSSSSSRGPWEAWEWLLTARPGVFGLVGGAANPTGVALIAVLTLMAVCSMPFVRKKGYFEVPETFELPFRLGGHVATCPNFVLQVFYFTHLLYWAYVVLLILHAPVFWEWILIPLVIFVVEKAYRATANVAGRGRSVIVEGVTMASRLASLSNAGANYSLRHT